MVVYGESAATVKAAGSKLYCMTPLTSSGVIGETPKWFIIASSAVASPMVYPFGCALATAWKPTAPLLPGWLVTKTWVPQVVSAAVASWRAVWSVPPPASNGTIISILSEGKFSA